MGGSSGKKQTVGYKYYVGEHLMLHRGVADKITEIQVADRTAWVGAGEDGTTISINAGDLFGGQKREGGIEGSVDLCFGGPAQGKNAYLQSKLGAVIPAFRGITAMVLRQVYMGVNPYLKNWAVRSQRIHRRGMEGVEQWYDEKAEIAEYLSSEVVFAAQLSLNVTDAGTDIATSYTGSGLGQTIYVASASTVLIVTAASAWSLFGHDGENGGKAWVVQFRVAFDDGDFSVFSSEYYSTANEALSGWNAEHPNGIYLTGSTSYQFYNLSSPIDDNRGSQEFSIVEREDRYQRNMNPAHIIREGLIDAKADGGQGYQDADIDDASFIAAANTLFDEQMGISLLWDNPSDHDAFIEEVCRHINAAVRIDHATGKFQLKLIRDDYVIGDLITLDSDAVISVEDFNRPSFTDLVNTVTVKIVDPNNNTQAVTASDSVLVQQQGGVVDATSDYPGFTNTDIASRVALRDLAALSQPLATATLRCTRAAAALNIGDVFILDMPDDGFDAMIVRVMGGNFGDHKSHEITLEVAQDVFSLPATGVVSEEDEGFTDPTDNDAAPAENRLVIEAPYYELVQEFGQTLADDVLASEPELGRLFVTADGPDLAVNADIVVDAGAGYDIADGVTVDFCPTAVLAAGVGHLDTGWTIETGADLSNVSLGTWALVGNEFVRVDAFDAAAGTLTVGRGVLDSLPAEHNAGAIAYFADQYGLGDGVDYADGETVNVKLVTTYSNSVLSIVDAPEDTLEFNARAIRPYPPAQVQIGGEYYPGSITDLNDLVVTWVGRDRTQQTSATLYDFEDANIGPEAGVTVNGYIYDGDTGVELLAEADITSPWSPAVSGSYRLRLELETLRDGYASYFLYSHVFDYSGSAVVTEASAALLTESGELIVTED